jgi:hypothetical protein
VAQAFAPAFIRKALPLGNEAAIREVIASFVGLNQKSAPGLASQIREERVQKIFTSALTAIFSSAVFPFATDHWYSTIGNRRCLPWA